MSRETLGTPRQGSWLLAWLAGTLVTLGLTLTALLLWISAISNSNPPAGGGGDTLMMTLYAAPYFAAGIGVTCFLVITIMTLAEARSPKPPAAWLLAGLFANAPAALVIWGLSNFGDCFDRCDKIDTLQTVAPSMCFYTFGILGTLAIYRVRRGAWHQ